MKLSINSFFRFLTSILNIKISLEDKLNNDSIDLTYFPVISNTVFSFKKINFISTFLDLEHFKHSIFPEISKNEFYKRENLYFYALKRSLLITVSHKIIKEKVSSHYKILRNKIIVIPYTPSNLFQNNKNIKSIKKKFKNIKNYFFYPAQIWGHKNHISILEAAKILQKKKYDVNFVFSGRDRGYKFFLDKYVKKNKLKNIYFTGFLQNAEMDFFYKNCKGVIFVSLFGPDAIPPLETWSYRKPLIYNNRKEDDVNNNTAILVDVKKPKSILNAIVLILKNKYNKKFISNGTKQLNNIRNNSKKSYIYLSKKISLLQNKIINNKSY